VRATTVCGIDYAIVKVSTTDRKRFGEQDRVDDVEEVESVVEGGGAVHVP
jgi:hypothetical protein